MFLFRRIVGVPEIGVGVAQRLAPHNVAESSLTNSSACIDPTSGSRLPRLGGGLPKSDDPHGLR